MKAASIVLDIGGYHRLFARGDNPDLVRAIVEKATDAGVLSLE